MVFLTSEIPWVSVCILDLRYPDIGVLDGRFLIFTLIVKHKNYTVSSDRTGA